MKPRPSSEPEPKTREEALALLWSFLKTRLKERRAKGVGLCVPTTVLHRLPGPNGYEQDLSWHADVPLEGEGRIILGGMMRTYPDHVRVAPETLALVLDVVFDLERQGVLRQSSDRNIHGMYITPDGARRLDTEEPPLPSGSTERVARLRAEFAGLARLDVIEKHYAQAVGAFAANLDLAAAVMVGASYEAGILGSASWSRSRSATSAPRAPLRG